MSTQTRKSLQKYIDNVQKHEAEFGRPLPPNAFYKIVARRAEKKLAAK